MVINKQLVYPSSIATAMYAHSFRCFNTPSDQPVRLEVMWTRCYVTEFLLMGKTGKFPCSKLGPVICDITFHGMRNHANMAFILLFTAEQGVLNILSNSKYLLW